MTPKIAILETLTEMDNFQAEKVLDYIKSIVNVSRESEDYDKFKEQALQEIRSALKQKD